MNFGQAFEPGAFQVVFPVSRVSGPAVDREGV